MKNSGFILVAFILSLFFAGCGNSEEKKAQKAKDLVTARTLGLAYLEEFELEKAEAEFLKFIKLAPKEKLGYANLGLTYLRMSRFDDAEKELLKGIKLDPADPDIRLILATVYRMNNNYDKAVEQLESALKASPGHVKVLYELTDIYDAIPGDESKKLRKEYMLELADKAPGNIVPHLNLTEIFIRDGNSDEAIAQLETIRQQFPDFPKESEDYYNKALELLRNGDSKNALIQFTIFHNYVKVSSPYQAGIMDLKGPGGSLIGFPLITFDQQASQANADAGTAFKTMKLVNVATIAGLDKIVVPSSIITEFSHVEAADFDGDGDIDLYVGNNEKHFLLSNEMGRFFDITAESGISHKGKERDAIFADYDNDGFLDLLVLTETGKVLYRNAGKGTFQDVTSKAGIKDKSGSRKALFFDADHDGDLDLLDLKEKGIQFYRNNADGTFTEQSQKMGISADNIACTDAAFGDFDEDGDIDFLITTDSDKNLLFSNQRQGVFKNIVETSGIRAEGGSGSVSVGDYNNDGFIDLLITSLSDNKHQLFRNKKDGSFEADNLASQAFAGSGNLKVRDSEFVDFDNDGFIDIILSGEAPENENGVFLLHNNGKGEFEDAIGLLPAEPMTGKKIATFDYNDDGDIDVAIAGVKGEIALLRNDGGNGNRYIKMKLVGLKAGSAKNNHFGIGAKVEVRSGELYQTMVVTNPDVHFGLGNRVQADVVRITWTNGVPQNIFMPNSDQALIEAQTLKGSCPFLYAWDGEKFTFIKDILWRSALGMPLGIMGGTTSYGFAEASDDYLKIPAEAIKPYKNQYTLQLTSELWETIYFDKLELIALDHPATNDVFVPEQFTPPPFPGRRVYQVNDPIIPVSAVDSKGNDILHSIAKKDDVYLSGYAPDKYQGIGETTEIILDPGKGIQTDKLCLFLNGWVFPTDASINVALSQSSQLKVNPPVIQVPDKTGKWVTVIDQPGFPMGKDKTMVIELSGKFLSDDHRVKIITNMEIYWDYIFFSHELAEAPAVYSEVKQLSADLHYRGFSRQFRKGGRYGPHWFDYADVDKEAKWRDLEGNYTRYGDVLPLLKESDNQYIISNAGDEITVVFDAGSLPPLKSGWNRDFLIRSVGWVKDGDINTAFGGTVEPLPFHGMKSYPPSKEDIYPDSLRDYNQKYNTRVVNSTPYLNALKTADSNNQ
jgi:tetratricopeptide (TPR) repeat protein